MRNKTTPFAPLGGLLLIAAISLILRPMEADGLWWHLSRGRAVLSGSLTPSSDLLAGATGAESDWLGGVPAYLAYSGLEQAGLLLMRVAVIGILAAVFWTQMPVRLSWMGLVVAATGLFAAQEAAAAGPIAWDALGIVTAWWLVRRWIANLGAGHLLALLGMVALWANHGPRTVLALGVLASGFVACRERSATSVRSGWKLSVLGLTAVACCLTPRGVWSLWDSLRVVIPRLASGSDILAETAWKPLAFEVTALETVAFQLLSLYGVVLLAVRPIVLRQTVWFCAIQFVAWNSAANLGPAAVWLVLWTLARLQETQEPIADLCSRLSRWLPTVRAATAIVLFSAVISHSAGWWSVTSTRLGWGVAPALETHLLKQSLADVKLEGSAHCTGVRAAGMLAWVAPSSSRPYDVPVRALLEDRLRKHVLINRDLAEQRRERYRRADGTWGGWWITLQNRNTRLIVLSADETRLIRGLEPSLWKPMSLDSPVISYAISGDECCSTRIVEVLQQRDFVNGGAWNYSMPAAGGRGLHTDMWGALTGEPNLGETLRQARVFRAMQQRVAALRVLHAALREAPCRKVRREFAQCQLELAYRERVASGRSSLFRATAWLVAADTPSTRTRRVLQSLRLGEFVGRQEDTKAGKGDERARARSERLPLTLSSPLSRSALRAYLAGEPDRAAGLIHGETVEEVYARACLMLEAGRPERSAAILDRLLETAPQERIAIAGRELRETLLF